MEDNLSPEQDLPFYFDFGDDGMTEEEELASYFVYLDQMDYLKSLRPADEPRG